MNTKEAIEFINGLTGFFNYPVSADFAEEKQAKVNNQKRDNVIDLLKRGEIDRKIIEKMKNDKYDVWISLPGSFTNIPKFVRDVEKEVVK